MKKIFLLSLALCSGTSLVAMDDTQTPSALNSTVSIIKTMVKSYKTVTITAYEATPEETEGLAKASAEALLQLCKTAKSFANKGIISATKVATALETDCGDDPQMRAVITFLRKEDEDTVATA